MHKVTTLTRIFLFLMLVNTANAEFRSYAEEALRIEVAFPEGRILTVDSKGDSGRIFGMIFGQEETIKLFLNEDQSSGKVKHIEFVWNDYLTDVGFGLHSEKHQAEILLKSLLDEYAIETGDEILKSFSQNIPKNFDTEKYDISFQYSEGPNAAERSVIIKEKENSPPSDDPKLGRAEISLENYGENELLLKIGTNYETVLKWIPAGDFLMGSGDLKSESYYDEFPVTKITLEKGFWMAEREVVQGEYMFFGDPGLSNSLIDLKPLALVSWNEAVQFCEDLNKRLKDVLPNGYIFSLPTEAHWEYACRAGTTTTYHSGDTVEHLENVDWVKSNSGQTTHHPKLKPANPWGLFDLHGNLKEWCLNSKETYPGGQIVGLLSLFDGKSNYKSIRGGSFKDSPDLCRSSVRDGFMKDNRSNRIGFRLALISEDLVKNIYPEAELEKQIKPQPGISRKPRKTTNAQKASSSDLATAREFIRELPAACRGSYLTVSQNGTVNIHIKCDGGGNKTDGLVSIKDGVVTRIR